MNWRLPIWMPCAPRVFSRAIIISSTAPRSGLDATIEHTGKAFVGLTLNCAKCHDHKYDPITHEDYYRFRAIFEPHQVRLDPVPGVTDFEKDGLRAYSIIISRSKRTSICAVIPSSPDTTRVMHAGVPAVLASFAPEIKPVNLPVYAYKLPAPRANMCAAITRRRPVRGGGRTKGIGRDSRASRKPIRRNSRSQNPTPPAPTPEFAVKDISSKLNAKLWEVIGKGWTAHRRTAPRIKPPPRARPSDWSCGQSCRAILQLICRYTHTGGALYKSVTFRFDVSADRKYANYVYTSAHASGPKLHVAYTARRHEHLPIRRPRGSAHHGRQILHGVPSGARSAGECLAE